MGETGEKPQGPIIEYSPYKPPKKKHGEGHWSVESRHMDKNYPLTWKWNPKHNLEEVPDSHSFENISEEKVKPSYIVDPVPRLPGESVFDWDRRRGEYAAKKFEEAGRPMGGAKDD